MANGASKRIGERTSRFKPDDVDMLVEPKGYNLFGKTKDFGVNF